MKKPLRTLVVCSLGAAALACSGGAFAQSYWRVDGGISKSRKADLKEDGTALTCGNAACTEGAVFDDLKSSGIFDLGWGYRFGFFRTDITVASRNAYHLDASDRRGENVSAEIKSIAAMFNMYFDFPARGSVTPFLGISVGASQNNVSAISGTRFAGVPDST